MRERGRSGLWAVGCGLGAVGAMGCRRAMTMAGRWREVGATLLADAPGRWTVVMVVVVDAQRGRRVMG